MIGLIPYSALRELHTEYPLGAARRAPREERRLLKEFKGIGDVSVDIFFCEVQLV